MYQLPGPSPYSHPQRISVMPRFASLLVIWVVLLGAYGSYRYFKPKPIAPVPNSGIAPENAQLQDIGRHLDSVAGQTAQIQNRIRISENLLHQALERADSPVQAKTLERTLGNLENVRQNLQRMREELNFIQPTLKETKHDE